MNSFIVYLPQLQIKWPKIFATLALLMVNASFSLGSLAKDFNPSWCQYVHGRRDFIKSQQQRSWYLQFPNE